MAVCTLKVLFFHSLTSSGSQAERYTLRSKLHPGHPLPPAEVLKVKVFLIKRFWGIADFDVLKPGSS